MVVCQFGTAIQLRIMSLRACYYILVAGAVKNVKFKEYFEKRKACKVSYIGGLTCGKVARKVIFLLS